MALKYHFLWTRRVKEADEKRFYTFNWSSNRPNDESSKKNGVLILLHITIAELHKNAYLFIKVQTIFCFFNGWSLRPPRNLEQQFIKILQHAASFDIFTNKHQLQLLREEKKRQNGERFIGKQLVERWKRKNYASLYRLMQKYN